MRATTPATRRRDQPPPLPNNERELERPLGRAVQTFEHPSPDAEAADAKAAPGYGDATQTSAELQTPDELRQQEYLARRGLDQLFASGELPNLSG